MYHHGILVGAAGWSTGRPRCGLQAGIKGNVHVVEANRSGVVEANGPGVVEAYCTATEGALGVEIQPYETRVATLHATPRHVHGTKGMSDFWMRS